MKTIVTDGGKPDGMQENNMDCTVRALAIAGNIGYAVAYILMEQSGREPGKSGIMPAGLAEYAKEGFGTSSHFYPEWNATLSQFVKQYPTGRFVVRVSSSQRRLAHVFAIVDGVPYDNSDLHGRKNIKAAWRIVPKD